MNGRQDGMINPKAWNQNIKLPAPFEFAPITPDKQNKHRNRRKLARYKKFLVAVEINKPYNIKKEEVGYAD